MTKSITTLLLIVLISCKTNKEIIQYPTGSSGWYSISNNNCNSLYNEDSSKLFCLSNKLIVSVTDIEKCKIKKNNISSHYLEIKFNKSAKRIWKQYTRENIGKTVFFVLDSVVIFNAKIATPISRTIALASSKDSTYYSKIISRIEKIKN